VFPVRYGPDLYILFRRNSVFKGLKGGPMGESSVETAAKGGNCQIFPLEFSTDISLVPMKY
jgi:hypothetical protein